MAGGWWEGVSKALEVIGGLTGGKDRGADDAGVPQRGAFGGIEARLAGVLVSALHEAFARDTARLEAEREQADDQRRRAEAALRLEVARQAADRQLAQLRAIVALDVVVWLASLLAVVVHPPVSLLAKGLLAVAWTALTAGVATAFVAYHAISSAPWAAMAVEAAPLPVRPRSLDAAAWLAVAGLGLAAATVVASLF